MTWDQYVAVVELDPNARPDQLCVVDCWLTHRMLELFEARDFSEGPKDVRTYGRCLSPRHRSGLDRIEESLERQEQLVLELRGELWTVANPDPRSTFSVYVIDPDPEALDLGVGRADRLPPPSIQPNWLLQPRDPVARVRFTGKTFASYSVGEQWRPAGRQMTSAADLAGW